MDWEQIIEMAELALKHNKDVTITIKADGNKQIECTTPQSCIVETNTRLRYVLEEMESGS